MNLIFFGTPEFAVPALSGIHQARHRILLVVCQPDRPAGRGRRIKTPAVKTLAQSLGLEIYQPESLDDSALRRFQSLSPDVAIVVAYGLIFPAQFLRIPHGGCVNLHASMLPKYRGAAPVAHAILNGEKSVGVTTLLMDEGIDTGPVLLQLETSLGEMETTGEAEARLAQLGADLLVKTLLRMERRDLEPRPQLSKGGTYAPKIRPEMARISWSEGSNPIIRRILALNPRPGATTLYRGSLVKIWRAGQCPLPHASGAPAGTIIQDQGWLHVACGGETCIRVDEIQIEGRRRISGAEALRGRWFEPGDRLGEAEPPETGA